MTDLIFLDEFGSYFSEGFADLVKQTRGLSVEERIDEIIKSIGNQNDSHSALISALHNDTFKHFSDENIEQLFNLAGIHIKSWHYYYQSSIPWDNTVRLGVFVTNHIHGGDIFKAIEHYEPPIPDMLMSVLSD